MCMGMWGPGKGMDAMNMMQMGMMGKAAAMGKAMGSLMSNWDNSWGEMTEKEQLVAKLKEIQRNDKDIRLMWERYCEAHGSKYYDLNRYDEAFLRGFEEMLHKQSGSSSSGGMDPDTNMGSTSFGSHDSGSDMGGMMGRGMGGYGSMVSHGGSHRGGPY